MKVKRLTASFLTALVLSNGASMLPFVNALSTDYVMAANNTQPQSQEFTLNQLENYKSYDLEVKTAENSKTSITYQKKYAEIFYKLPENINASQIKNLTINLSSGDASSIAIKLYNEVSQDPVTETQVVYGTNTIQPTSGDFVAFGIMSIADQQPSSITIDSITIEIGAKPTIQKDIPDWKDSITKSLGDNAIAGTIVQYSQLNDDTLFELIPKHFNAITIENELKPDCLFGYSNDKCPGTQEVELNGEKVLIPTLDFTRADAILDKILEMNEKNPDNQVKVRGHVLLWHSQTPKWFFCEDYDKTKSYVSADEMNKRLECYIKTIMEHYFNENSKYKDLFYGWDVVNEAVSDKGGYRTDKEPGADTLDDDIRSTKSTWWYIYQNNDFINNAFVYANKYAPNNIELYYNDYNTYIPAKRDTIVDLLTDIKNTEGARIDGMGMQAHYNLESPSINAFETVLRTFSEVVDKVQITELDLKASSNYDGTDTTQSDEYTKQAYRYKALYESIIKLNAEDGINVSGITMWGSIDTYSWLQNVSNVGGGADGNQKHCPLLFDGNYQAKPAFWAFVDSSKLDPQIQKINIIQQADKINYNTLYSFGNDECNVDFTPTWNGNKLKVHVNVKDSTLDSNDKIILFIDPENSKSENIKPLTVTVARSQAIKTNEGYSADIELELPNIEIAKKIGFDLRVNNGNTQVSFNDLNNTQDTSSKNYAEAIFKPYITINKGTVTIDGEKDAVWNKDNKSVPLTISIGSSNVKANANLLWDNENLYLYAEVKDNVLNSENKEYYEQDSFEIFIDENNGKTDSYEQDDKQYRISFENITSFSGQKCTQENLKSATKLTDDGYIIEAAFKWTDIQPKDNTNIGLELQVNDADASGKRIGTLSWFDETGMGWSAPSVLGTATLIDNNSSNSGFTDVPNNYWGKQAIDFVCEKNLFNGTSETEFSPEGKMNRAMIVTVLARLAGVDTTNGSTWYEAGVNWAKENGISDGTNLNASVSREQLATMLYRYAGSPKVNSAAQSFTDSDKISSWASDAMNWAINEGLISGMGDGTVNPQGEATRAQVATIIQRFVSNMN